MEESQLHIPEGWEGRELGTLYLEKRKSKFKVSDATNYGGIPFYTSGDAVLEHNEIQTDGENIFLATGGIANVKFYNGNVAYSTDTYVIVGKENIDTQFLYFKILDQLYYINTNFFQGSGLKHLQKKDFRKHLFAMPKTKGEQQSIAAILSKTDQAIANTEALIAKYTKIKTGLMQDLLTKGIDENGNIRNEQTHEFKDSPLGRIPKEWVCEKLSDFCNEKHLGSVQTGPFGSQLHFSDYKNEGTPIITVEHLKNENISHQDLPLVGKEDYIRLKKYNLITGDLVFSRVGAIDRCSIVTEKENNWLFSGRCLRVRPGNQFNSEYLLRQMNFDFVRSQINNNAVGSTMKCLNTQILSDILIVKPKITEQERIVVLFNKSNELISKIETELTKLQSLKTGLMQDLLSGKVRVNNLEIKEANETALA